MNFRNTYLIPPILLFTIIVLLPSCVSKQKFLNEVERRATCDTTLQQLNNRNLVLNREIANLKLQLAEKNGEANALREMQDKQDAHINRLELEIERLTDQSLNQQSAMDGALFLKERQLEEAQATIQGLKDAVTNQESKLNEVISEIKTALPELEETDVSFAIRDDQLFVRLSEKAIFRSGTTRLSSSGSDLLEAIANILLQHPELDVLVLGHADNKPVRGRSVSDNWDLSVLRATAVARTLTKEFGMNPNQVTAAGKGEFKPVASNETAEGRALNRRTELVISGQTEKILRMIKNSE